MTQQRETDDRRDDAATYVVGHVSYKTRQDALGGARDDRRRACDMGPVQAQQPSLHPNDIPPEWMRMDLTRLESAFPAFSFTICQGRHGPRFEAWRDTTAGGLYAIITGDPGELWRELDRAVR